MANCFSDIIGIRSACDTVPGTSGLFIEDIGITTEYCDSIINSNYRNGLELIKDKIEFASKIVKGTINNEFASKIITRSFVESRTLGQAQDSLQMKLGITGNLGGIAKTIKNSNSYFELFVTSVSLQINFTGEKDVFVYDLISGQLLDTVKVTCVANKISTAVVNKTYASDKRKLDLIFVYDTTGVESNNTILYLGCGHCSGYKYSDNYLTAAPVYLESTSAKIRSSLTGSNHTFGMSINYSIRCGTDKWLCELSNQMALPLLYKTGELIMEYAINYSERTNSETNVDAERNQTRKDTYASEYNKALNATIRKINIPKGDPCFICNDYVKNVTILP